MEKEPLITLPWHGHETIESIPALLDDALEIEITLPVNYNHSLFSLLHGDDAPGRVEEVRASGGPELLAKIASVKGLEELSSLIEPLTAAGAKVRVLSPPRIVITLPANAKKQEQLKRDIH
ncbi:hypothetical protein C8R31_102178 [Nitrosospira sp. Nsp2]|uniref:hypothetical protein n=1 Tax=Nitrosospira sp. Nsp2 TaxID=136548 RepID=UPI000D2F5114|nr:hypothetical protein [Nitrosospira sp. Nsp2]PTR16164.1 hypothetical protein C8R31_102178 [Nitrosospira sp. Nsp2]